MADELYARVGAAIRSRREVIGLTQEALAIRTGLKRSSITNIERGGQAILLHQLVQLARALRTDPSDFLSAASTADGGPGPARAQDPRASELLTRLDQPTRPKRT